MGAFRVRRIYEPHLDECVEHARRIPLVSDLVSHVRRTHAYQHAILVHLCGV